MRRRIELRLFQGAAAEQALAGLGRCGISAADVRCHFESGHLVADAGLLIACLVELLAQSAEGTRGADAKETSLAAINQSHKLRLEVIKLIASIADGSRGGSAPQFVSQTINMLLSDQQAGEMRKVATGRTGAGRRN